MRLTETFPSSSRANNPRDTMSRFRASPSCGVDHRPNYALHALFIADTGPPTGGDNCGLCGMLRR